MKKKNKVLQRIITVCSVALVLAGFAYIVFAGFDFTDKFSQGRKWGFFGILFVLNFLWNGILFLIYLVTEQRTLEIKRPLAEE